jgi:hypothetical protein
VLKSRYAHLRILLAIAIIAVIGLTIAVVILAGNTRTGAPATADGHGNSAGTELRLPSHAREQGGAPVPDLRAPWPDGWLYNGGPDERTGNTLAPPTTRHDSGPEEGTRGAGFSGD